MGERVLSGKGKRKQKKNRKEKGALGKYESDEGRRFLQRIRGYEKQPCVRHVSVFLASPTALRLQELRTAFVTIKGSDEQVILGGCKVQVKIHPSPAAAP